MNIPMCFCFIKGPWCASEAAGNLDKSMSTQNGRERERRGKRLQNSYLLGKSTFIS